MSCEVGSIHITHVSHPPNAPSARVGPTPSSHGQPWRREGPGCNNLPRLQEPVLRLDLRRLEDGKGKSPYDPGHRAASVLVGESKGWDPTQLLKPHKVPKPSLECRGLP